MINAGHDMSTLLLALGLMLLIEGAGPLLAPRAWREAFSRALALADGQLRFIGLVSVVIGAALVLSFR